MFLETSPEPRVDGRCMPSRKLVEAVYERHHGLSVQSLNRLSWDQARLCIVKPNYASFQCFPYFPTSPQACLVYHAPPPQQPLITYADFSSALNPARTVLCSLPLSSPASLCFPSLNGKTIIENNSYAVPDSGGEKEKMEQASSIYTPSSARLRSRATARSAEVEPVFGWYSMLYDVFAEVTRLLNNLARLRC